VIVSRPCISSPRGAAADRLRSDGWFDIAAAQLAGNAASHLLPRATLPARDCNCACSPTRVQPDDVDHGARSDIAVRRGVDARAVAGDRVGGDGRGTPVARAWWPRCGSVPPCSRDLDRLMVLVDRDGFWRVTGAVRRMDASATASTVTPRKLETQMPHERDLVRTRCAAIRSRSPPRCSRGPVATSCASTCRSEP